MRSSAILEAHEDQTALDVQIEKFGELMANRPEDLTIVLAYAEANLLRGNLLEALQSYQKVVAAKPDDAEPRAALARIYLASQMFDEAYSELATLLSANPANAVAHLLLSKLRLVASPPPALNWMTSQYEGFVPDERAVAHLREKFEIERDAINRTIEDLARMRDGKDDPVLDFYVQSARSRQGFADESLGLVSHWEQVLAERAAARAAAEADEARRLAFIAQVQEDVASVVGSDLSFADKIERLEAWLRYPELPAELQDLIRSNQDAVRAAEEQARQQALAAAYQELMDRLTAIDASPDPLSDKIDQLEALANTEGVPEDVIDTIRRRQSEYRDQIEARRIAQIEALNADIEAIEARDASASEKADALEELLGRVEVPDEQQNALRMRIKTLREQAEEEGRRPRLDPDRQNFYNGIKANLDDIVGNVGKTRFVTAVLIVTADGHIVLRDEKETLQDDLVTDFVRNGMAVLNELRAQEGATKEFNLWSLEFAKGKGILVVKSVDAGHLLLVLGGAGASFGAFKLAIDKAQPQLTGVLGNAPPAV